MLKHERGGTGPDGGGADDAGSPGAADDQATRDDNGKPARGIVCVACNHRITDPSEGTEIAGRHHHTCVNPGGYVYRIACYTQAPGAIGEGEWSDDYSWFKDYWWQLGLCRGCACHIGWHFSGAPDFWGLIRDRIRES